MKIAISNIAWDNNEEQAILEFLSVHGISHLEVAPTKYWNDPVSVPPSEIDRQKRRLNELGFEVIAAQALFFGHPELSIFGEKELRKTTLEYLRRVSETSIRLGAKALVFGAPKNRLRGNLSEQVVSEIAADFFQEAAEQIFSLGGILCLEPNPVEYGCDFITTSKQAIAFVERINHPGLRVQLDTSTMTINGENPLEVIEKGLAWTGHFHISEPYLGLIDAGKTKHAAIAKKLHNMSFDGPLSIEMRSGLGTSNCESVKSAIKLVKSLYC